MKKDVYICVSYFHLLTSILKAIKKPKTSDLIICTNYKDNKLCNDKRLITKLKEKNIFDKIIIFDYSKIELKYLHNKLFKVFFPYLVIIQNKYELKKYKEIYIFNDKILIGRILNIKRIKYNVIEDGTDAYKNNYEKRIKQKKNLEYYIKKMCGYSFLGTSKNVKSIEVNNKDGLSPELLKKRIVEMPKEKLFKNLTKKEKQDIIDIFLHEKLDMNKYNNANLIITQPLSEDKLLNSEEEKIELYKEIIKDYSSDKVIIKTHPRENTNYNNYFKDYIVIDYPFPIELINFFSVHINYAITISSTSLSQIENVNEKVFLGWDWLENKREEIKWKSKQTKH